MTWFGLAELLVLFVLFALDILDFGGTCCFGFALCRLVLVDVWFA